MERRELILVGLIIVLAGALVAAVIVNRGGDESTEAGEATTTTSAPAGDDEGTTTTLAPTTTAAPATTAAPTTTSTTTTTTTSTTTTTTTTTTVPAPVIQVVADITDRSLMGLPLDSSFDEVFFAMVEVFGAPDFDSNWLVNECRPEPGRTMSWDGLMLWFQRLNGDETLINWTWRRGTPIPTGTLPVDPQPEAWIIKLHDGVTLDMTLREIGDQIGVPATFLDIGIPVVDIDGRGSAYIGTDSLDAAPSSVAARLQTCG